VVAPPPEPPPEETAAPSPALLREPVPEHPPRTSKAVASTVKPARAGARVRSIILFMDILLVKIKQVQTPTANSEGVAGNSSTGREITLICFFGAGH
jgi:hypothetical protein